MKTTTKKAKIGKRIEIPADLYGSDLWSGCYKRDDVTSRPSRESLLRRLNKAAKIARDEGYAELLDDVLLGVSATQERIVKSILKDRQFTWRKLEKEFGLTKDKLMLEIVAIDRFLERFINDTAGTVDAIIEKEAKRSGK